MKQKHSTEKKDKYERQKLIDSHITDDVDYNNLTQEYIDLLNLEQPTKDSKVQQRPPPEPPDLLFPEQNWKYSNGKWIPPEEP